LRITCAATTSLFSKSAIVAVNGWIELPYATGKSVLPWPMTIFDSAR
jgi:hypothetical protein